MSQAGKDVMVKAVLHAIPSYIMSIFKIPKSVINRFEQMIKNFWCSQDTDKRKIHWVARKVLTVNKK